MEQALHWCLGHPNLSHQTDKNASAHVSLWSLNVAPYTLVQKGNETDYSCHTDIVAKYGKMGMILIPTGINWLLQLAHLNMPMFRALLIMY